MIKKYFIYCSVLFTLAADLFSQGTGTIMGTVSNMATKEKLFGVNVVVVGTQLGAATDIDGNYEIKNVPVGNYQVRASAIGYNALVKSDIIVASGRPSMVDFDLKEKIVEVGGVTVTSELFRQDVTEVSSVASFSFEEIRRAPGGFEDVVRALSIVPGVAQADAGRNDLIVRGGAPSENLYLVDGFLIQNINHFGSQGATGGPLSFINLDYVKETSFSTGGFSALYGDKLSSVLSIDLREGRRDRWGGKLTISATQFGLNAEGPLSENSTLLFSVRRSYLDFIFKAAGFGFVPEYWDVITKYNYKIDNKNSISYLYVGAFDNVRYFNDTRDKRVDNSRVLGSDQILYISGLSYRNLFSKGFLDVRLSRNHSGFNFQQNDSLLNPVFRNKSKEGENSLQASLFYQITPKSEITIGGDAKYVNFKADVKLPFFKTTFGDILSITSLDKKENFMKYAFYSQYSGYYFNRLRFNLGMRVDYFDAIKKFAFSPRFSLGYYLTEVTNLNFSTGIYHQSPSYIWLVGNPINKELDYLRVDQYILGLDHKLRYDVIAKIEGYYKDYKNYPTSTLRPYIIMANTGAGFGGGDNNFAEFGLDPLVSLGTGNSRGIEFSMQKKSSDIPHYGIMSVTYNETYFTPLDGIKRPGSYDQRWIINLTAGYIFNERWEAGVKFRFSTGKPYTPFNPDGTQNVSDLNSQRIVENHSLDIRIDRRFNFSKWNLIVYLDIQNIYNRKNLSAVRWDPKTRTTDSESAIGILPSIGISAEL